jgi:hypothetical protein
MILRIFVLIFAALVITVGLAIFYDAAQWRAKTRKLLAKLGAARSTPRPATYDPREIELLPPPVQRYFRAALTDGQPMIAVARFSPRGQFNMSEVKEEWKRFESTQVATTRRPGFVWDARVTMAPGLNAFVHDCYVAGEGLLQAQLLGLVTVADMRGTPEMAHGELLRYFAEAAWYPTALLPSQGVNWEAIDDSTARASLTDDATTVSLEFRFNPEGLIDTMRAAARYRVANGVLEAAPWQCRVWDYAVREGMRIPLEGEVAWQLPIGFWPYWRGHITEIAYEFAR